MATLVSDILTIPWLKSTYLQGIDLTDGSGVALADAVFSEAIASSIRYIEDLLDIRITPTIIKNERQDIHRIDRQVFWMRNAYNKPLMSIDAVRLQLGNIQLVTVPASWVFTIAPEFGTFNIIPTMDQLMVGSHAFSVMMAYNGDMMPGALEFDYHAGMAVLEGTFVLPQGATTATVPLGQTLLTTEYSGQCSLISPALVDAGISVVFGALGNDAFDVVASVGPSEATTVRWVLSTLPNDVKALIGLRASLLPLHVAGTTLLGPGVSTKSVSIDGLSQSLGSTANANKLAYGNRSDAHEKMFDQMMPYARGRYTGPGISIS